MQEFVTNIVSHAGTLAPVLFVVVRTLPIVIPPLPGAFIDVIGIAVFGWFDGFLLAFSASLIGTVIPFYIARRWRESLLKRFLVIQKLHVWESRFSEGRKFWGVVLLRMISAPVADYVSYAAGLTNIHAGRFFIASAVASVAVGLPYYYFGGILYDRSIWHLVAFVIVVIGGVSLLARRIYKNS